MMSLFLYPLLAGLGVALVAGPLGTFVVWRRMAYFGETLSHSALLGVAFGFLLNVNVQVAVMVGCIVLSLLLVWLQQKRMMATDTLLGILAHSALSLGLVVVSLLGAVRVDMMAYLFGDLLAVSQTDLFWIYGGGACVLLLLARFWSQFISITVHEELAQVEGVPVERMRLILMLLIALVIAVAMKIVGVLLITSLLIIPAATAQRIARSPEQMAIGASVMGMLSVTGGMWASLKWDTPTGPSVVVCSAALFLLVMSVSALTGTNQRRQIS
ncbi:zinc ABC transporter permease subunit ZnuB [Sansalvadorimonas verongulae]|uniref:zinc ABC transporter permease subunit ZnuB n=1 Tax=Sansalvadorimonas verongulae TaxID=2172824 RepID=UPI0012BD038F|nr:zinc ABC transporter permease subunit ZnuB [Sansalvadorimonas verongulae]MTI14941.1 zinc ABC transporter permease subunit ZnuB [Sansalvadorimonas verongulae]